MRLAVVTSVPHCWHDDRWWATAPLVLELERWGNVFDRLVVVAPVAHAAPDSSCAGYAPTTAVDVEPTAHLPTFEQQRTTALHLFRMQRALWRASRRSDAIQVRAPCNAALAALSIAPLLSRHRIAKYAGQWTTYAGEPRSFRLQRRLLKSRWWAGPVLFYGRQSDARALQVPCFNTVLDDAAMQRARRASERARLSSSSARLLFVGRLTEEKRVDVLIEAFAQLDGPRRAQLHIVGDGPQRAALARRVAELELEDAVHFVGAQSFEQVQGWYERSDVLVLASQSEGWPKAIVEAMAFGVMVVGSDRGLVPWILGDGRGQVVTPGGSQDLARVLEAILSTGECEQQRRRAARWAQQFTLDALEQSLRETLARHWQMASLRTEDAGTQARRSLVVNGARR